MTDAFKAMIEKEADKPIPSGFRGYDWFQLSDAEEEIFDIDIYRMPHILSAWEAYQAFKGMTSGAHWDIHHQGLIDTAIAARPDLAAEAYSESGWTNFATAFSRLTMREAWQWWVKHEAWQTRNGIMQFADGS